MATKPSHDFGKRRPVTPLPPAPVPVKRSGHVALLLMGTLAVGGGAYALMPGETCQPTPPGLTQPSGPQQAGTGCQPRGSSSGGGHSSGGLSSRSSFFSSDTSSSHSASGTSDAGSGSVQRGGFGSFAHGFAGHFSGG